MLQTVRRERPLDVSVSDSVVNTYIAIWRRARLSTGSAGGWPPNSILGRIVEMGPYAASTRGRGIHIPPNNQRDEDAEFIQRLVEEMLDGVRTSFEAFHVGVIRGESCRGLPHKARALTLGIDRSTYYDRVEAGRRYLAQRIGEMLDIPYTKCEYREYPL